MNMIQIEHVSKSFGAFQVLNNCSTHVDKGDVVPGLGRIEAFRKQDGRWVVVTPKGLIVAR